jgi:hypothetical protein
MTHIFIQRILLMRQFSFRAFSYDAYFHYASSLTTLTLIPRILLRRLKVVTSEKIGGSGVTSTLGIGMEVW